MILILEKANQQTWGFLSGIITRIMVVLENESASQKPSIEQEKFWLVLHEKGASKRK